MPAARYGVSAEQVHEEWQLVAATQAGDREAYGTLWRRYHPIVTQAITGRVQGHHPELVADIVGETFAVALHKIGTLQESPNRRPLGWWITIAGNKLRDHWKSGWYRYEAPTEGLDFGLAERRSYLLPESAGVAAARRRAAARVLREIQPQYREVLVRWYIHQQTVGEVRAAMGIGSDVAVKQLRWRALQAAQALVGLQARLLLEPDADPVVRYRPDTHCVDRKAAMR